MASSNKMYPEDKNLKGAEGKRKNLGKDEEKTIKKGTDTLHRKESGFSKLGEKTFVDKKDRK